MYSVVFKCKQRTKHLLKLHLLKAFVLNDCFKKRGSACLALQYKWLFFSICVAQRLPSNYTHLSMCVAGMICYFQFPFMSHFYSISSNDQNHGGTNKLISLGLEFILSDVDVTFLVTFTRLRVSTMYTVAWDEYGQLGQIQPPSFFCCFSWHQDSKNLSDWICPTKPNLPHFSVTYKFFKASICLK